MTMPLAICIAVLAVCLLSILGLILAKLHKIPLYIVLALLSGVAIWQGTVQWQAMGDSALADAKTIYLSLLYLDEGTLSDDDLQQARSQLTQVETATYVSAGVELLIDRISAQETLAKLDYDIAMTRYDDKDQQELLTDIQELDMADEDAVGDGCSLLSKALGLDRDTQKEVETLFKYQYAPALYRDDDDAIDKYEALYGQEAATLWLLNGAIADGDYSDAFSLACDLVEANPSQENRLILAETIAQYDYAGLSPLDNSDFGGTNETSSEQKQLNNAAADALDELEAVEKAISKSDDAQERLELAEEYSVLQTQYQQLQAQADHIYIWRALNSISDIDTLESEVLKARLYFAADAYDLAVDALVETATVEEYVQALPALQTVANSVSGISGSLYTDQTLSQSMYEVLSYATPSLTATSQSLLTTSFIQAIEDELEYAAHNLYISRLDVSDYPTVSVQLVANDDILTDIKNQIDVVARDSQQNVTYTVTDFIDADPVTTNICMVVDYSGSMDGTPIQNARTALVDFASQAPSATQLSLVKFASSAEIVTQPTLDRAQFCADAETIYAGGGTDIGAGIQVGCDVLENLDGTRIMFLMTDGNSSVDMSVVTRAAAAGIIIYTIGFGSVNEALLTQIAEATGGTFTLAQDSEDLARVYASLGASVSGNLTISYTAPDPTATEGEFFLRSLRYNVSARASYSLAPQAVTEAVSLQYLTVPLVSSTALQTAFERGNTTTRILMGSHLDLIASLSVGGIPVEITSASSEKLTFVIPDLPEGVYDLEATDINGNTTALSPGLVIGESVNQSYFTIGNLAIRSEYAAIVGQDLVLCGTCYIQDINQLEVGTTNTLDLQSEGMFLIPDGSSYDETFLRYERYIQLLSTQDLACSGLLYTSRSSYSTLDASYTLSNSVTLAVGNYTIAIDSLSSTIQGGTPS